MKRIIGYEIRVDGKPATLGLPIVDERGVIIPATPTARTLFVERGELRKPKTAYLRAHKIIKRTLDAAKQIKASVVYDWVAVQDLVKPHAYTIHPVYQEKTT